MALSLKQVNKTPKANLTQHESDKITSKPWGDIHPPSQGYERELSQDLKSLKEHNFQKKLLKRAINDDYNQKQVNISTNLSNDFFEERFVFKRNALGPGARALWCEVLNM